MTDERRKSIDQIIGLIIATDNEEIQNELWVRAQTDKIASLEDRMVCDACGETFEPEDIDDEDETYCPKHKGYHSDHVEINYGPSITVSSDALVRSSSKYTNIF